MTESMDELDARHKRERDAKTLEAIQAAYREGYARAPLTAECVPAISRIHGTVASKHGLTPKEMMEPTRAPRVSHPRQEAFSRAQKAGYSLPEIGRYFGGLDHTTVLHGIKAHEARASA